MATYFDKILPGAQGLLGLKAQKMEMADYEAQKNDLQEASNYLRDYYKNGNQESLINATLKNPQLASQVLTASGLDDKRKQQAAAQDLAELWQLSGNPEAFKARALQRAESIMQRGGNPSDTINLMMTYDKDPEQAKQLMRSIGAGLESVGYQTGIFGDSSADTPLSQQEFKYYQQLKQTDPQAAQEYAMGRGYVQSGREASITPQVQNLKTYKEMVAKGDPDAENFGISSGLLSKEGRQLDAATTKALQDSMTESESNSANVYKYVDLAERFKSSDIAGGILGSGGSWREAAKAALGTQDEVTKLTSEWQKIRSGEAISSLPQGPATDADIRLALKPLPENANAEYMDKYLRGLAKMAAYKAEYNQAKADFISENGSLRAKDGTNFGRAWSTKRKDVLDRIAADERFTPRKLTKDEFVISEDVQTTTPQGAKAIGRFTVEVEN